MRASIVDVIKSFMVLNILTMFMMMLFYISIVVGLFYFLNVWNLSLLKETIYWTFGVAFILLVNINDAAKDEKYFKKTILNSFKIIIILEFLTNLYAFNLIIELISLPIILLFTMVSAFSQNKEENKAAKNLSDSLIAIYGILVLIFSIYHVTKDFKNIATIPNLKSFFLSPVLTTLYVPFMYFTALYMTYESFFTHKKWILKENKKLFRSIKWQVLKKCNLSLTRIRRVSNKLHIYTTEEKSKILKDLNMILND